MIQMSPLKRRVILVQQTTLVSSSQMKSLFSKFQVSSSGNTIIWASLMELLRWKITQLLLKFAWKISSNEAVIFKMQINLLELSLMSALKQLPMLQISEH
jgi:hypothetical protein